MKDESGGEFEINSKDSEEAINEDDPGWRARKMRCASPASRYEREMDRAVRHQMGLVVREVVVLLWTVELNPL